MAAIYLATMQHIFKRRTREKKMKSTIFPLSPTLNKQPESILFGILDHATKAAASLKQGGDA
jgi:hypothetical protein